MTSILDKAGKKNGKLDHASSPAQPPKCPECASQKIWKDGLRSTKNGDVQRWLCRDCGYRFSRNRSRKSSEPSRKSLEWRINRSSAYNLDRQVCEFLTEGSKNLAKVETRTEKQAAGATAKADIKGKIVEYAFWMKKQGYAETTIVVYLNYLKSLVREGADIFSPESVKEVIANWTESMKLTAISSYTLFLKMLELTWIPPKCNVTRKLPFIPTEEEIDSLISSCGKKTATFLQLVKETAMRAGEANSLRWTTLDYERQVIILNSPEKNSYARIFKISGKLVAMLKALPRKNEYVFGGGPVSSRRMVFNASRKKAAKKLQNPRLLRIHFHTLRHWKATTLYHKTKDVLYVKRFLGHRNIDSTLLYVQIADTIFKETTDEFTVKVAKTASEIKSLLEVGFEYVCEKDELIFLRKRK